MLRYLFARFDERFDGAPTLLILDEAWLFLDEPSFAARIRQWLKTLRKKNVSVVFATQSLADIKDSTIAPAIIESCASRIFLPNPQATEPQIRTIYEGFGLNSRQIEIVATAQPKRDYYYQSRLGNRLFDLDLGPAALAFAGVSTPQDQRDIDRVLTQAGAPGFAGAWLRHRGLDWAADLLPSSTAAAFSSLLNFRRFHHEDQARLLSVSLAAVLSVSLLAVQPASALTVFDPSNFVQNTLIAVRTLEQINNQINQLQNEAQMLMNQARNLANLDFNIVNRLRSTLATTERLIAEARGLAYDVQSMDATFARLYPEQYAATISGDQMLRDAQERWKKLERPAYRDADAGAGVAEPRSRRKRAGRPREPEPVGHRRAASDAGDQPAPCLAGQAVHPGAAAPDHARPGGFTGTGAAGGSDGARPRSAAALPGHRHAVHAAVRQLLQQLTGGGHALAVLLTACGQSSGQQRADDLAATLAADPAQGAACPMRSREDTCRAAAEAFRRRFFAGQTGPDEYRTLAELPPIPASFDTPTDDAPEGDAPLAATEDAP